MWSSTVWQRVVTTFTKTHALICIRLRKKLIVDHMENDGRECTSRHGLHLIFGQGDRLSASIRCGAGVMFSFSQRLVDSFYRLENIVKIRQRTTTQGNALGGTRKLHADDQRRVMSIRVGLWLHKFVLQTSEGKSTLMNDMRWTGQRSENVLCSSATGTCRKVWCCETEGTLSGIIRM